MSLFNINSVITVADERILCDVIQERQHAPKLVNERDAPVWAVCRSP